MNPQATYVQILIQTIRRYSEHTLTYKPSLQIAQLPISSLHLNSHLGDLDSNISMTGLARYQMRQSATHLAASHQALPHIADASTPNTDRSLTPFLTLSVSAPYPLP